MRPQQPFTFFTHQQRLTFPPFVNDFHPKTKVTLDWETFISTLARLPRLSSTSSSNMIMNFYEIVLS
jgi:hypothetical protein